MSELLPQDILMAPGSESRRQRAEEHSKMILMNDLTKALLFFLLPVVLQGLDSFVSALPSEETQCCTGCVADIQVLQMKLLLLLTLEMQSTLNRPLKMLL